MSKKTLDRPFLLFQRGKEILYDHYFQGLYYVRFRDPNTGEYGKALSTGRTTESEAVSRAYHWYIKGIH